MEPEEVLVNFQVGNSNVVAHADAIAKAVGVLETQTEKMSKAGYFAKMAGEVAQLGAAFKDFAPAAIFTKAINDSSAIMRNVQAIGASAKMSSKQFADLNAGIIQGAAETGASFEDVSARAKELYNATGLKDQLGESVVNAERLGLVFGTSQESFGKLTAHMVQFGDGAVKADDVMKSFDKVTGVTGKRMEDMLESINEISKTMRNVVGGGTKFGQSMKEITTFAGQMTAQFTEMGGDSAVLNELMKDVMDPNKWGDIAQKMPGMAGNLYAMNQAMTSGDMEKFGQLLKDGAQQTANMGAGMSTIARGAAGIDFTSAEMLTKVDFKKMGKDASGSNSVMERSAGILKDVSTQFNTFLNRMSQALAPVVMPLLQGLSWLLGMINQLMGAFDGWVGIIVTWGIIATGVIWSLVKIAKSMAKETAKAVGDAAVEIGKGVGKAAGEAVGGFMEAIGKAASSMARFAVPLMQAGAALLLFAASVYVLAQAFKVLQEVDLAKAALGMLLVIGAFIAFVVMAVLLAPVAPALLLVGGAFLLFAGAVWIMAKAGEILVNSFMLIGKLDYVNIAMGLMTLSGALLALLPGAAAAFLAIPALAGLAVVLALLDWSVGDVGDQLNMVSKSFAGIGAAAESISKIKTIDTTGLKSMVEAVKMFDGIKIETSIDEKVVESIKGVLTVMKMFADAFVELAAVGMTLASSVAGGGNVSKAITFAMVFIVDSLSTALTTLDKKLQTHINKDLTDSVMASLKFVPELFKSFIDIFADMAAMGMMLQSSATGSGIKEAIKTATDFIIETIGGAVLTLDKKLQSWTNSDLTDSVMKSLSFVIDLFKSFNSVFVDLTVMGMMLSGTTSKGGNIAGFITYGVDTIIGIISGAMSKLREIKDIEGGSKAISSMSTAVGDLGKMINPLIELTAFGSVFKSGQDQNLFYFADTLAGFMGRLHSASGTFTQDDLSRLSQASDKMTQFGSALSDDIKISTKTGADLAISDHTQATAEHQQAVETLLAEIRDGIKEMGGQTAPQVVTTHGNTPAWRPEAMFSDGDGVF